MVQKGTEQGFGTRINPHRNRKVFEKKQEMMYNKEENKDRRRTKLRFKKAVAEKATKQKRYKKKSKKSTNEIINDNIEELYAFDF